MSNIDFKEFEKLIIDNIYIGDKKFVDLVSSGRLVLVGICKECCGYEEPLKCVYNGEVMAVTQPRCSVWCGFTDDNGWCYKFRSKGEVEHK